MNGNPFGNLKFEIDREMLRIIDWPKAYREYRDRRLS